MCSSPNGVPGHIEGSAPNWNRPGDQCLRVVDPCQAAANKQMTVGPASTGRRETVSQQNEPENVKSNAVYVAYQCRTRSETVKVLRCRR